MKKHNKPELLAPAGDLEKLRVAVEYGADAVYLAGQSYGLRAKAGNFDPKEMEEGIAFAHQKGAKVYVAANVFARNEDFDRIASYFIQLEKLGADGVIVTDPGFFDVAREVVPSLDVHISTQANTTNYGSVLFWERMGAKRIVLARELGLREIKTIHEQAPNMELEVFVHGAMCISYSGRCLLSSYMTGRDANRGECAHPCRYQYAVEEMTRPGMFMPVEEDGRGTYIFSSKDLCMIEYVPQLIEAGVDSFKIEGRMKSAYYVATAVKAYRRAIDEYVENPRSFEERKQAYLEEINKAGHRGLTTGFFMEAPDQTAQNYTDSGYVRSYDYVGIVLAYDTASAMATVEQKNKFGIGDEVEFLTAVGEGHIQVVDVLHGADGETIQSAPHARQVVKMKTLRPVRPDDMLRKRTTVSRKEVQSV